MDFNKPIYHLPFTKMPFELKLAWRYFRTRRKGLVRWTSLVAVAGIAAGVAALIVTQAISKGFSSEMREKVLANTSHITIFAEAGKTNIADWRIIKGQVEGIENVENFSPTTYESAVISTDENSAYAVLRVQNSGFRVQGSEFEDQRPKTGNQISIGKELAEKLNLKSGDEAKIITLEKGETPKTSDVRIKDVFETGLYEYDSTWIFVDETNYLKLKTAEKFSPEIFSVAVRDIYRADETAGFIRKRLGTDFKVLDWQEANKPLFAALSLERKAALAVILLIIFIAVLNITTTLSLLVAERKLDIAILRTCGAKTKNLVTLFLFEGIILSSAGIFIGLAVGLTVCFLGNYFKLIGLSREVYSLHYIPFQAESADILLTVGLTFLLSLAAIVYPVLKASRIKPLENLRIG